ncbi:MAG: phosphoesterase [Flavobacteriaceae bacterium]|nr:phosphoesterase [Flavobacteriaceae bacterium]
MKLKIIPFYFLIATLILSCATYSPQYRETETTYTYPLNKTVENTFYLVGDAGKSPLGGMSTGLKVYQKFIKNKNTEGTFTIFLGDNIYPDGMPPEGAVGRDVAAYMLDAQLDAAADFKGQLYFIPGNHDWYNNGLEGVTREQEYLEKKLEGQHVFQPMDGCPLKSVSVSPNIQLIMIDSQWYLEDWNLHPNINKNCDIKTREKFFIELELELEKNKNKSVVFAMHHPMFTNGTHGGFFGANKHLYPTQRNIPMPILSSLVAQIRSQGGVSVQDRYNELSNKFMNKLATVARKHENLVFASGHEHSLQHIEQDGLIQILSGSGAKSGFAALAKNGLFSYGGQGFAVYDIFTDGSSYVRYYGADAKEEPTLLFEKEVHKPKETIILSELPESFSETIKTPIYKQDSINEALFFKTVWGKKYKDAYATPITARVGNLDSLYGGLEVVRTSNSSDYKNLLLQDKSGNLYNMRALQKQALKVIDKKSVLKNENPENQDIDDPQKSDFIAPETYGSEFYTAAHPYAIMAIPTLADSINIFNNKPNLFYIPKQRALKNYNVDYGDELYYISVAPSENNEGDRIFRYARDIETTDDILLKLRKANNVKIDEETYIKTRLFDMLIGDWDREPDHWRWALYYTKGNDSVYVPIARNRDDAFASLDGDILDVARSIFGSSNQRHIYTENLTDFKWFNSEGVILDRALLQRSSITQWKYIAEVIQSQVTDEVIDFAFESVPPESRGEALDEIINTLKARRDNLLSIAESYYKYLNKLRTVAGTNGRNYFEITRMPDNSVIVKEFDYSTGQKGKLEKEITYYEDQTKQLWIFGLDGEDVFEVTGEGKGTMLLRLIGGQDKDSYAIKNGNRLRVYDHESKPNEIIQQEGGIVRFTDLYTLNTYDYRKQVSSENSFVATAGYNPDDGARVGLQYIYEINGFSRNPFSKQHRFNAGYYHDTSSFDVAYQGEIANLYKTLNFSFGARVTSPNYILNYFGYGNETPNLQDDGGYNANRVEVQTFSGNIGLLRNSYFGSFFKLQSRFEAIIVNSPITGVVNPKNTAVIDETNLYGTLEGVYSYRSFDDARNPARGMMFDLNLGLTDNFMEVKRVFGFLNSRIGFYNSLISNEKLVLKTNVQSQFIFGNRFDFHQAVHIGGNNGLRGFREERFAGKSSLLGSADVRYSFNEFKIELFPIQIGVYTGADLGRVWTPSGSSERWHNSYGGGFWLNSRGGFTLTSSLFHSTEDTRFVFGLNFGF